MRILRSRNDAIKPAARRTSGAETRRTSGADTNTMPLPAAAAPHMHACLRASNTGCCCRCRDCWPCPIDVHARSPSTRAGATERQQFILQTTTEELVSCSSRPHLAAAAAAAAAAAVYLSVRACMVDAWLMDGCVRAPAAGGGCSLLCLHSAASCCESACCWQLSDEASDPSGQSVHGTAAHLACMRTTCRRTSCARVCRREMNAT
jgi:hypothetical protein